MTFSSIFGTWRRAIVTCVLVSTAALVLVAARCAASGAIADAAVPAGASAPPIGLAIDTIATKDGSRGVRIGDDFSGAQFYAMPDHTEALQLLVLDRKTLAVVQNVSYRNDAAGAANLLSAVKRLTSDDLVIVTKPDPDVNNNPSGEPYVGDPVAAASINQALAAIGASPVPAKRSTAAGCDSTLDCATFSAIGVPGIPVGQGTLNPGLPGVGVAPGDLHGYLRKDLAGTAFAFVNVERVPFSTGDPTADPAVVTIGSDEPGSEVRKTTYTSDKISGPGFFVLVLDAGDLRPLDQFTISDTSTDVTNDLSSMAFKLRFDAGTGTNSETFVVVRSIGDVGRVAAQAATWDTIANLLQALGGSRYYFEALDGTSSSHYAQVGPAGGPGYPSPWTQVASRDASDSGELSGLLARNSSSQFYPADPYPAHLNGDRSEPLAGSLAGLMSLPSEPWPDRGTQGEQSAIDCIAKHVYDLGPLRTPIQVNYTNTNLIDDWNGMARDLYGKDNYQALAGQPDCGSFSEADFDTVADQLHKEWTALPAVWNLIRNLQSPLIESQSSILAQIAKTTADLSNALNTNTTTVHYDGLAIASDVLLLAAAIPGVDEVAAPLEFLASGLSLAGDLDLNDDGSNALVDVTGPAATLGVTLAKKYTTEINGLNESGDILVTNWSMLRIVAENAANTTNAPADWSWGTNSNTQAADGLLLATREQAYKTLFPVVFKLYRLQKGAGNATSTAGYPCAYMYQSDDEYGPTMPVTVSWNPFSGVTANGSADVVTAAAGPLEHWAYARSDDGWIDDEGKAQLPTTDLLDKLFTEKQTELGLDRPLFNPLQFDLEAYPSTDAPGVAVNHVNDTISWNGRSYSTLNQCKKS